MMLMTRDCAGQVLLAAQYIELRSRYSCACGLAAGAINWRQWFLQTGSAGTRGPGNRRWDYGF